MLLIMQKKKKIPLDEEKVNCFCFREKRTSPTETGDFSVTESE